MVGHFLSVCVPEFCAAFYSIIKKCGRAVRDLRHNIFMTYMSMSRCGFRRELWVISICRRRMKASFLIKSFLDILVQVEQVGYNKIEDSPALSGGRTCPLPFCGARLLSDYPRFNHCGGAGQFPLHKTVRCCYCFDLALFIWLSPCFILGFGVSVPFSLRSCK